MIPPRRILSGVQPSGTMHLGNYLGALRHFVDLQNEAECLFCVVDLHAITVWQEPAELARRTREVAAAYLAVGLDPERATFFIQSTVAAHCEMAWLLNCVARLGWLERMVQFKEKAGKDKERASVGLYTYPLLMAADILLYRTTHVPVGEDQKQHLELTRNVALKFNSDYGQGEEILIPCTPLIVKTAARVMSLRDGRRKMSKSEDSDMTCLLLTDDADLLAKKLRKAKTDSALLPDARVLTQAQVFDPAFVAERPEAANLLTIAAALDATPLSRWLDQAAGKNFAWLKEQLIERAVATLVPIGARMRSLLEDPAYLDDILARGGEKAAALAAPTLQDTKNALGLLRPAARRPRPAPGQPHAEKNLRPDAQSDLGSRPSRRPSRPSRPAGDDEIKA